VLGGDAGILVDPDSVPQVSAAMLQLLSDPPLRRRLGLGGLHRLDAMFRYPRFKESLLSHLWEVLEGGLRSPQLTEQQA
jgi:glycosyltransferase involved in cell wall biosynthesis